MVRAPVLSLVLFCAACSGGCGGSAAPGASASGTGEASTGPTRLAPGLGDESLAAPEPGGAGPTRLEEEAVDPPPVEPPP